MLLKMPEMENIGPCLDEIGLDRLSQFVAFLPLHGAGIKIEQLREALVGRNDGAARPFHDQDAVDDGFISRAQMCRELFQGLLRFAKPKGSLLHQAFEPLPALPHILDHPVECRRQLSDLQRAGLGGHGLQVPRRHPLGRARGIDDRARQLAAGNDAQKVNNHQRDDGRNQQQDALPRQQHQHLIVRAQRQQHPRLSVESRPRVQPAGNEGVFPAAGFLIQTLIVAQPVVDRVPLVENAPDPRGIRMTHKLSGGIENHQEPRLADFQPVRLAPQAGSRYRRTDDVGYQSGLGEHGIEHIDGRNRPRTVRFKERHHATLQRGLLAPLSVRLRRAEPASFRAHQHPSVQIHQGDVFKKFVILGHPGKKPRISFDILIQVAAELVFHEVLYFNDHPGHLLFDIGADFTDQFDGFCELSLHQRLACQRLGGEINDDQRQKAGRNGKQQNTGSD